MQTSGIISKMVVGSLVIVLLASFISVFVSAFVQSYSVPGWQNYTISNETEIQNMTESMKNTILEDTTQEVGVGGDLLTLLQGAEYAIRLPLTALTSSYSLIADFFTVWPFNFLTIYINQVYAIITAIVILAILAILLRYAHI